MINQLTYDFNSKYRCSVMTKPKNQQKQYHSTPYKKIINYWNYNQSHPIIKTMGQTSFTHQLISVRNVNI